MQLAVRVKIRPFIPYKQRPSPKAITNKESTAATQWQIRNGCVIYHHSSTSIISPVFLSKVSSRLSRLSSLTSNENEVIEIPTSTDLPSIFPTINLLNNRYLCFSLSLFLFYSSGSCGGGGGGGGCLCYVVLREMMVMVVLEVVYERGGGDICGTYYLI